MSKHPRSRNETAKLAPYTFGDTQACHILVDMMNGGFIPAKERPKVAKFILCATYQFKWLSTIEDLKAAMCAMSLTKDHLTASIDKMPYPPKFKSFLNNVICHHYRRYVGKALKRAASKKGS